MDEVGEQWTILKFAKRPNLGVPFLAIVLSVELDASGNFTKIDSQLDWLQHATRFTSDDPMYRIRRKLEPDQHYVLFLASIEFPDLGISTIDNDGIDLGPDMVELLASADLNISLERTFPDTVLERCQAPETLEGWRKFKTSTIDEINRLIVERPRRVKRGHFFVNDTRDKEDLSLVFGSCQYPAGIIDRQVAYASYRALNEAITEHTQPNESRPFDGMLLLGDQVYIDATAGLFDAQDLVESYRAPYTSWLSNRFVKRSLRSMPVYMMLDDHEIYDNFEPTPSHTAAVTGSKVNLPNRLKQPASTPLQKGVEGFRHFQFGQELGRNEDFFYGPINTLPTPVFMLNTRTDRKLRRPETMHESEMLSMEQLGELEGWLRQVGTEKPCVITTSSLFLPRHFPIEAPYIQDGMDGYPQTLEAVLDLVVEFKEHKLLFLSGDEHFPLLATVEVFDESDALVTKTFSLHTPALYAPFPFANGYPEQLVDDDTILFQDRHGKEHTAKVSVKLLGRCQGFTHLSIQKTQSEWAFSRTGHQEETVLPLRLPSAAYQGHGEAGRYRRRTLAEALQ